MSEIRSDLCPILEPSHTKYHTACHIPYCLSDRMAAPRSRQTQGNLGTQSHGASRHFAGDVSRVAEETFEAKSLPWPSAGRVSVGYADRDEHAARGDRNRPPVSRTAASDECPCEDQHAHRRIHGTLLAGLGSRQRKRDSAEPVLRGNPTSDAGAVLRTSLDSQGRLA